MKKLILVLILAVAAVSCTTKKTSPEASAIAPDTEKRSVAQVNNPVNDTLNRIESKYQACINDKNNQSTNGAIQCAAAKHAAADLELNKLYKGIMKSGDAVLTKRLKAAQQAWITFRDANCSLQGASNAGGSLERMIISGCTADMTFTRAHELNVIASESY